jgi:putative nucleotidyltransferase with HDIG domain
MTTATPQALAVGRRLRERLADRLARCELDLPLLPEAAANVVALCQSGDADPRELAATLQRDPALAAHVIRIANSATYAPVEPIVSLQQAASRLGLRCLGEVALTAALQGRVFDVRGHENWAQTQWRHAVLTAAWAREVCRVLRSNGETAYLCALLHDAGVPILLQAASEELRRSGSELARDQLEPILIELHGEAGCRLAEQWHMPPSVREAMQCHHDVDRALDFGNDVRITALADQLAHLHEAHAATTLSADGVRSECGKLLDALGIYDDDLERLLARSEWVGQQAAAFA